LATNVFEPLCVVHVCYGVIFCQEEALLLELEEAKALQEMCDMEEEQMGTAAAEKVVC
jgi:hypothetical protein